MGDTPKPETASLSLEAALYDSGAGRFSVASTPAPTPPAPAPEQKRSKSNKPDHDES